MFTVLVASDCDGVKLNYELTFPATPSIAELRRQAESVYACELSRPSFHIARLQVYMTGTGWVDLTSPSQLWNRCQVFAFEDLPLPPTVSPAPVTSVSPKGVVLREDATHAEKVRAVYNHGVAEGWDVKSFAAMLDMLRFEFSNNTTAALASHADRNRDGVISLAEWEAFGELYPTLVESLYDRIRAHYEDVERLNAIRGSKELLSELKEKHQMAAVRLLEAERDCNAQCTRLSTQEGALATAVDSQLKAENALLQGRRDVETARGERDTRAAELSAQQEREHTSALMHADAGRRTEEAASRLQAAQAATAAALEGERVCEGVLAAAQAEVERQRAHTAQRTAELMDARSREQAASMSVAEAARATEAAGERLAQAEIIATARKTREQELGNELHEAQTRTVHASRLREEEDALLQGAREKEEAAHLRRLAAEREVEEADRLVQALQATHLAFTQQQRSFMDQEGPLILEEIRLREQRDSLEARETKLRTESHAMATSPTMRTAAASPSPSRYYMTPTKSASPSLHHALLGTTA